MSRHYPTPAHAEAAAQQPQHRDLLAAIVANRAYSRPLPAPVRA